MRRLGEKSTGQVPVGAGVRWKRRSESGGVGVRRIRKRSVGSRIEAVAGAERCSAVGGEVAEQASLIRTSGSLGSQPEDPRFPGRARACAGDTAHKDRASARGRARSTASTARTGGGGREGEAKSQPADQFHGALPEEALVPLLVLKRPQGGAQTGLEE